MPQKPASRFSIKDPQAKLDGCASNVSDIMRTSKLSRATCNRILDGGAVTRKSCLQFNRGLIALGAKVTVEGDIVEHLPSQNAAT